MSRIRIDHNLVSKHRFAIAGHSTTFDVTIPSVTGGTVPAVAEANALGTKAGQISRRYATALPHSARDIQTIASNFRQTDDEMSAQMRATMM